MDIKSYKIKKHPSNIDLFIKNEFEILGVITFEKDIIKTQKQVFEKILYLCEKWNIKITKRKANEIAKEVKWIL